MDMGSRLNGAGEVGELMEETEGRNEKDEEEERAKNEALDEGKVLKSAMELERAISSLLQVADDPPKRIAANDWLAQFVTQPFAWTAALYLAFPPAQSPFGNSLEIRYFTLNVLLGKIRSDWIQLGSDDAWEMFDTLLRQVPYNLGNPWFTSRIFVLVSAAAGVAGEDATFELVQSVLREKPLVEFPLAFELLATVAEEIFVRSRALPREVAGCLQDSSTEVFQFLENKVKNFPNLQQDAQLLVCLERWINAGFTLSELYHMYPNLFNALLEALGSEEDKCFEAAVSTLSEYIAAVEILPGREEAVRMTISAILAQQGKYRMAAGVGMVQSSPTLRIHSRGLVILISVLATSEGALLARGGSEASVVLDWLVDASGGGGGLGLEGAAIAAAAWPSLAAISASKRADTLQAPRFAAAAQAVLESAKYGVDCEDEDKTDLEGDEMLRYREGVAAEALVAFHQQLGSALLSHILVQLHQASTWQSTEVCLFAAATLSSKVMTLAGLSSSEPKLLFSEEENAVAKSFLAAIFSWMSVNILTSDLDMAKSPCLKLVQSALMVVENYAQWTASDLGSLEAGMKYTMSAFNIPQVRGDAARTLGRLCRAAAPHIVAARALAPIFNTYELALSASEGLEGSERLAFVEGLAVVASALPPADATAALSSLTMTAVSTIKALAEMRAHADISGQTFALELRVLTAVVNSGCQTQGDPALHPALTILHEIWSALDVVADRWAGDSDVASAICELWGITAAKVGVVLAGVLPRVISSATAMYAQHRVPSCLECLSNIVMLSSADTGIGKEVDQYLATSFCEITDTIGDLEKIEDDARSKKGPDHKTQIGREVEMENTEQQNAETLLCSICELSRAFLHHKPLILLSSPAFLKIIQCAINCVRRADVASALAGAKLLSDVILCFSFSEDDFKGKVIWQLPEELVHHVDSVVAMYGVHVVEVVLRSLAKDQLVDSLRDGLADVLYGLCMRYPEATSVAMLSTFSAKDFPARRGVWSEADKKIFVSAAAKHPVHPRRRFQELIHDFSQVCRGAVPVEKLSSYY